MSRWIAFVLLLLTGIGCSREFAASSAIAPEAEKIMMSMEPSGALSIKEAHASSDSGTTTVVVGRIGGTAKPFVDGLAVFNIVDLSVEGCESDPHCRAPCNLPPEELKVSTALVKLIGDNGSVIPRDTRELLPVSNSSIVVVHGRTKRNDHGNLTILAKKVFVRPAK